MSWGQHFFHWNTPDYWAEVNRQQETNLHNTYAVFEKYPRAILEIGVVIGGILIPIAAAFDPAHARQSAHRCSSRRPRCCPPRSSCIGVKLADMAFQKGYVGELLHRPSETIELYLYFFILAYLIVFTRRIREIKTE